MTRPTEVPTFDPRVHPPQAAPAPRQTTAPEAASGRQTFRELESYPWPPPETAEERKIEMQRGSREQEWALGEQALTTTEFGLEPEGRTHVPQPEIGIVSPIQCQLCALRFCYCCFPNVAVNLIITATRKGGAYRYKCKMCFVGMKTRAAIYQHCAKSHIPKEYVDLRYPFSKEELAVIASRDEDKYNTEFNPRNLPLRPGILLPHEHLPVDIDTPSGLE